MIEFIINSPIKERTLIFEDEKVIYKNEEFLYEDIVSFRSENIVHSNIIASSDEFSISAVTKKNSFLDIVFYQNMVIRQSPENLSELIIDLFWEKFGNRILDNYLTKIKEGQKVRICDVQVDNSGVHYTRKPLFSKKKSFHIKWSMLNVEIDNTYYILSGDGAKPKSIFKDEMNLPILIEIIKRKSNL